MRGWTKLFLLFGSLLVALFLAEAAVRVYESLAQPSHPTLTAQYKGLLARGDVRHPFLLISHPPGARIYRETGEVDIYNNLGFKGPDIQAKKPPGTIRIFALGGSATEGRGDNHYPFFLQNLLKRKYGNRSIEVLNAGVSAWSTAHTLINLALRVVHLSPDVLIIYHNINDLIVNYFPDFQTDYANKYLNPYFFPRGLSLFYRALKVSRLFSLLRPRLVLAQDRIASWMGRDNRMRFGEYKTLPGLKVFERNLEQIVLVGKNAGARIFLVSMAGNFLPDRLRLTFSHKSYNDVVIYPEPKQFQAHFEKYNAVVREVARRYSVGFVDAYAALKDSSFFIDIIHLTRRGNKKLSGLVFRALEEGRMLDGKGKREKARQGGE